MVFLLNFKILTLKSSNHEKIMYRSNRILLTSSVFTSCTENTLLDDDQIILETQAIDKDDSTNRNNDGGEEIDNEED